MIKNLLEMWLLIGVSARLVVEACMHVGLLLGLTLESKRAFKCLW